MSGFTKTLLAWHDPAARPMPWKNERDPYKIWLSEIILQQTRVEQGTPYYMRFTAAFPTVEKLAGATENEVFKLWEGLGYYTRARNVHKAAKVIVGKLNGSFPTSYDEILKLPGIGPYTAAAIASFAFDLPHAVLDGNVFRVLSRVFGIETPIGSTDGRQVFTKKAEELLDKNRPGPFNQAIMDFGATVCSPAKPACSSCPMNGFCRAFLENRVVELPVKSPKAAKRDRFFHYFIFKKGEKRWVKQRSEKDIWQGLHEFPMAEKSSLETTPEQLLAMAGAHFYSGKMTLAQISNPFKQLLTHQKIMAVFCEIEIDEGVFQEIGNIEIKQIDLIKMTFPRIIDLYLSDKAITFEPSLKNNEVREHKIFHLLKQNIMVNRVTLIGNLGKDPEVRRLDSGAIVAQFSLATNESYKDKEGNWQNLTEWHNIVVWRELAERAEKYFKKGNLMYVEGKITHRKYTDANGVERYITDIVANVVRPLEKREGGSFSPTPVPGAENEPVNYRQSGNGQGSGAAVAVGGDSGDNPPAPVEGDLPF